MVYYYCSDNNCYNNTDVNRRAFNRIRNKVQREIDKIKKNFERDLAKRAKKNPKDIYKYLKSKSKVRVGIGDFARRSRKRKIPFNR